MATATTTLEQQSSSDPLSPSNWTTPQELCLLQSLTYYKPVGVHKHFRMLSILNTLHGSGTIPQPLSDHPHASAAEGIWRKLESLYDLKALDEREDAVFGDVIDDEDGEGEESVEKKTEYWREFELPSTEFESRMWDRRLEGDGNEGWSDDEEGDQKMRESTIGDSEDPRSSPIDASSARGTRFGRRAAGRRLAEVKQEDIVSTSKGSRRTSKAASPSVAEDTEIQDADGQDDEENEDDEDESDQEETTEDEKKINTRTSRGRGGRRGRGRRGRRAR